MKLISFLFVLVISFSYSEELCIISWNVESTGADAHVVAKRIADFQGYDIWGLSEVEGKSAAQLFEKAAGKGEEHKFDSILGSTGRDQRLLIVYNKSRLKMLESFELHEVNINGRVRSPLVAKFYDRETEETFLFMVNHLYRSRWYYRHKQAKLLNNWASRQKIPVIAVGDYNFDWDISRGEKKHDRGFDYLTKDGVFNWVRPDELVKTQSHRFFNSVLDFIFTTIKSENYECEIIVESGDFPDDHLTSDHRPISAKITISNEFLKASSSSLKQVKKHNKLNLIEQ
ncbi:endonuclease/exonuclease/phosphatase family protein [Candidatus Uabimicrobium sp. HlEnr_7]|uniref:endonuclease/exonuclease/phosphatase family protein n=1 Tax=Candidatus Uabimicrobium helgolandensis TaxID=3095367 RepID=UPI00355757CD